MSPANWWRCAKTFGVEKNKPKPRTPEEWHKKFLKSVINLPNVSAITLNFSSRGVGQTGIRHFKYYMIPPILHWNKDVSFKYNKSRDVPPIKPKIIVETKQGELLEKEVLNMKSDEILGWIEDSTKEVKKE